jgi:hypothetical protein
MDVISSSGSRVSYLSCGLTNPALGSYASTYSFGEPERHLFSHPIKEMTVDAIRASSGSSD